MLILDCAQVFPEFRHRELAWRMTDEDLVCVSPATFYRVLAGKGLVPGWPEPLRYEPGRGRLERATAPDEKWLVDPTYVWVSPRWWYLIYFIDEWSRYIVYWDLLASLDEQTMEDAVSRALAVPGRRRQPAIQTDNGPAFVSGEFKRHLAELGITHQRIRPHCPTDNSIVERAIRTGKELAGDRFEGTEEGRRVIERAINYYNLDRRHSALYYLRPVDYYRGDPQALLAARAAKIAAAREHRKRVNLSWPGPSRGGPVLLERDQKDSLNQEPVLSHFA